MRRNLGTNGNLEFHITILKKKCKRREMFIRCFRLKRRVVPDSQKIMMGANCGVRQTNTNE